MKRLNAFLAYSAAGLTIAAAVAGPLVWFGVFTRAAAKTSLRISPAYSGGEPARVIARDGYRIVVYKPVPKSAPLSPTAAFVQIVWTPASALPARISEPVDLNGNGQPDCVVSFGVPRDPKAELRVTVKPVTALVEPLNNAGKVSFSSLIARVNDTIVVRVPLR